MHPFDAVKSPNVVALHPPPACHATQLSLRDRRNSLHPLKQNAPSIAEENVDTFDDVDISDPIRPPPSALTSTTATAYNPHAEVPSPLENYSSSPRTSHQRSLTGTFFDNCQPLLNRATSTLQQHTSRTSLHSPTKSLASFIPSRGAIESTASQPKIRAGAKALQNWFNGATTGASGQVTFGVGIRQEDSDSEEYDSEEDDVDDMMTGIFNRGTSLTRASSDSQEPPQAPTSTKRPATSSTSTASSRFAWLLNTQKNAAIPPPVASPTYHNAEDDLLNLNISQALFPHGPVDPLAPSSFNDLLSTAESLLSRYQSSYRQLSTALVDARAEQSAQDDELDEADTRIMHLKSQLETMAARANDQDEQMRRLMEELMFERRARQEEEAARKKSLAMVRRDTHHEIPDTDSVHSPRRRNRVSNSDVSVDSGFESECETDGASIFSRNNCLSPTGTDLSSVAETDDRQTTPKGKKPELMHRSSTYDKVRDGTARLEKNGWGCTNCEGGSQSAVWGRLAKEREENSVLRRRVGELEEAVEGALNVVDGPWGL
ncbi:uncharacterized protein N0V89_005598 [Didymosphaeria variabile]|uniref:Uncharacterized protein n=1 Tax=Didymosphaeria variabile TaxID=1932322 RepID=A0A9W8XN72_9PLEO|nr:uncharacterized protein N0V89_005598 [Didymosphaeria variabile]KAJ4353868.1 hypothetical protein N0V89_005598 [Didymosphaeria variabile]